MLKFSLRSEDLGRGNWVRDAVGCWVNGASWIAPFPHPAVESFLGRVDGRVTVVVREAVRGRRGPSQEMPGGRWIQEIERNVLSDWPGDYVVLRIGGNESAVEVSIEAGRWGSAPVYLHATETALHGSWDAATLPYRPARADLDSRSVVEHLTLTGGYGPRTLWRGLVMVPERGRASWYPGSECVGLSEPDHAVHYLPRSLRPHADVLAHYGEALAMAVGVRDVNVDELVVEVSGGTDSATVALVVGDLCPEVSSYGLLIEGQGRPQQIYRRACITATARMVDRVVHTLCHLPLQRGATDRRQLPGEEPYAAAVGAALANTSARVVLTGIGGDELCALHPDERSRDASSAPSSPQVDEAVVAVLTDEAREILYAGLRAEPQWPITSVASSALRACAARAPMFLREGRWPVAPLCSPDLIRFVEWLPPHWREGKTIARRWLASRGLPDDVVWPRQRENFTEVMQLGLRRHGLPTLGSLIDGDGLAVVDLGYVDGDRLRRSVRAATDAADTGSAVPTYLHEVLVVERALRAWSA